MTYENLAKAETEINVQTSRYTPVEASVDEHKEEVIVGEVVQEHEAKLVLEGQKTKDKKKKDKEKDTPKLAKQREAQEREAERVREENKKFREAQQEAKRQLAQKEKEA